MKLNKSTISLIIVEMILRLIVLPLPINLMFTVHPLHDDNELNFSIQESYESKNSSSKK